MTGSSERPNFDTGEPDRLHSALTDVANDREGLAAIFAYAAVGLSEISLDGRFLRVNDHLCRLLGRSRAWLLEHSVNDVTHADDIPACEEAIGRLIATAAPLTVAKRYLCEGGDLVYAESSLTLLTDSQRQPVSLLAVTVDLTRHHRVEQTLRHREAELIASEEQLRLLYESATDYAIMLIDARRMITSWNSGAAAIFGYQEAEVLGRSSDIIFTADDRERGEPQREQETALRLGRALDERWHVRKDGSQFYASGVMIRLGEQGERGFAKVARDLTHRKRNEDALRDARDRLEARVAERTAELATAMRARTELQRRLTDAQEQERLRISRELHDGVGQHITGLLLRLKVLEEQCGPQNAASVAVVRNLVDEIAKEIHDVALELRPTSLDDVGLVAAMRAYCQSWSQRSGILIEFHAGRNQRLSREVETALYRVLQEALNNIVKHAKAMRVSVLLEWRDGEVALVVEDDGVGFDAEHEAPAAEARGRVGLLGMRERMAAIGGRLEIESTPGGGGAAVYATAPLGA